MATHEISRSQSAKLAKDIEAAVRPLLEAAGLEYRLGGITYGEHFGIKIQAHPVRRDEASGINLASPEAKEYRSWAQLLDLDPEALGKTFTMNGAEYILTGYSSRSPKYPFRATKVADGRTYKINKHPIERAFGTKV